MWGKEQCGERSSSDKRSNFALTYKVFQGAKNKRTDSEQAGSVRACGTAGGRREAPTGMLAAVNHFNARICDGQQKASSQRSTLPNAAWQRRRCVREGSAGEGFPASICGRQSHPGWSGARTHGVG